MSNRNSSLNQSHLNDVDKSKLDSMLLDGLEEERKRIARDVHDGLKYQIIMLKEYVYQLDTVNFTDDDKLRLLNMINSLMITTRDIAYNLCPKMLEKYDLGTCLKLELIDKDASLSQVSISTEYIQVLYEVSLHDAVKLNLLRIVQEAVQNALTHSRATEIVVQLRQTDNDLLILSIHDNGKGFDTSKVDVSKTFGLKNLELRAKNINAECNIYSEIGNGTIVIVEYPL